MMLPATIAYLGPQGTFSEQAAHQFFEPLPGQPVPASPAIQVQYQPCTSLDEIFEHLRKGSADAGVLPMENSTEGSVTRTLDLLVGAPVHIVAECCLWIHHHLLSQIPRLNDIQAVCAHPQALAQCQGWLSQHLPQAKRVAASSNAQGAQTAAQNPQWAAIAGDRAAQHFHLPIVARDIQDEAHNRTRFVLVAPLDKSLPVASGLAQPHAHLDEKYRTSLIVSVPNHAGALYDLLAPLKKHGVSLTRFESRPAKSSKWEYLFYMDLEGHEAKAPTQQALNELRSLCAFYQSLGSYAVAEAIEP
jgi:chorismate mutase/prephenate dehydratase